MEASETLVKILESVMQSHERLVGSLTHLEERQREHTLALAQAIGENTRSLAQILDRIEARAEAIDARIAADNRALAEILKYIADTTSRTEQMTARVLTEVSKGASH